MTENAVTTVLAIYGAFVASIGGIWNIYQWWSRGPKLSGYSGINMMILNDPSRNPDQMYVTFNIANRGTADTYITNIGFFGYDSVVAYWRGRPSFTAVVVHSMPACPLPGPLPVGGEWRSMMIQDDKVENLTRSKIACFALFHTFSSKPFRVRIRSIPLKP